MVYSKHVRKLEIKENLTRFRPSYFFVLIFILVFLLVLSVVSAADFDSDGVDDGVDVCPYLADPGQTDTNGDGIGDACYHNQGNCGQAIECFCGDTMSDNFTMVVNLRDRYGNANCTATGLNIGPYYSKLDCQGNSIVGNWGGGSTYPYDGLAATNIRRMNEIFNCTIHNFQNGIKYVGDGPAFRMDYCDLNHNSLYGIATIGSADVQIFNSSIHHNKGGIMSDETLRYFIRDNHIYSNDGTGIALGCSTVWTDDLNVVVDDKHQVLNNLVEDNADFGVWLSICSNSTVAGNVIRGNNIGFSFAIAKSLYRKNIGDIVTIGRIGRDRTMNNLIANNTVYDNFRNLEITFNSGGMADWIDYDSPYYLPFDNYFQNNSFGGREVEYYYGSSNGVFNMKNLNAFICMGCSNITIFNSSISELYLAYCNDTDEDADIYNILSEDPYNAITKFIAHGIYFENYTVKRARNGVAYENGSENNTFVNIFLSGSEGNCVDSDGDGYGVCPACGFESGCAKSGDDCDDSNPNVYPGAREVYDFVDNDCDGLIDLEDRDLFKQSCLCDFNKDGLVSFPDINIISATSGSENCGYYGNPETDWCNFTDVNRDGLVNNVDMSIFILWINAGTCDCSLGPELCDGYDNDCDGKVDEVFCCGDGKCDELETCSNCAGDCGACSHESPGGPGNPMGPGGYRYQCSDGIDNDADGLIDYPADPGCDSTNDNSELDGGGLADCVASWNCSEWGDCIEGIKTRECHDSNNCGTTVSMPETEKRCDIVLRTVLRYDLIFVDVLSGVCFIGIVSFVVWMIVKRKD